MKRFKIKILLFSLALILGIGMIGINKVIAATTLDSNDYYSLLATAIDVADTNTFEDNKNPQMFDSSSEVFKKAVFARKDIDTYASSIEAESAYEFSNKYSKAFSTSLDTSVSVYSVTTDISGKFDTNVNTESWKQQVESYEYYYWFAQKYIINIDWKSRDISSALSSSFKRELKDVDSITSAKALLREYGTHVYNTYVLGGKLEITKYFTQDASYELSETEKSVAASLNVIVDTAKVDAKVSGSVNLSTYESNSSSSSSYYSKLGYHSYGGNVNGAATASDLFQYKTQFGTGIASGFLYEAWTNSFNNDGVALKVVSAEKAVAIWDILDSKEYETQIPYLKKAFNNMCYESYAEKCGDFGVACEYIDTLTYTSKGTNISISPYASIINLPENTAVKINLSNLITDKFDSKEYSLQLSSESAASLNNDILTINNDTAGRSFNIELFIDGLKAYTLGVTIKQGLYSGGYGTAQQPYLISTNSDLISVLGDLSSSNNYYQLTSDIDLKGEKIDVSGSGTRASFEGVFDGNSFTIKNCTVKASNFNNNFPYVGLFGRNNGTIKNLVLDNVICLTDGLVAINNTNVSLSAGTLVGYNAGVVYNCYVKNSAIRVSTDIKMDSGILNVGGIVGYSEGLIENSAFSNGNIYGMAIRGNGKINVGGIVGTLAGSKISESYVNTSRINASNGGATTFTLGGIVGCMQTRTAEDTSIINPKLTMCLAYNISKNKDGSTFGYIAGTEEKGEFANCYYTALKEQSVSGRTKSNCTRKDSLKVDLLPSVFHNNWSDGTDGPVLNMHTKED